MQDSLLISLTHPQMSSINCRIRFFEAHPSIYFCSFWGSFTPFQNKTAVNPAQITPRAGFYGILSTVVAPKGATPCWHSTIFFLFLELVAYSSRGNCPFGGNCPLSGTRAREVSVRPNYKLSLLSFSPALRAGLT